MRHGSRRDSGSRHSADTLRSSSGVAEADSGTGVAGKSACESREEEKVCEQEDEGCEDEQRSWETSAAEGVEPDHHSDNGGGVFVCLPSGTSTPSVSKSEPSRNTMRKYSLLCFISNVTVSHGLKDGAAASPPVQQGAPAAHQRDPRDVSA